VLVVSECCLSEPMSAWPEHRTAGLVSGATAAPRNPDLIAAHQSCMETRPENRLRLRLERHSLARPVRFFLHRA